jgi:hypothetical protein
VIEGAILRVRGERMSSAEGPDTSWSDDLDLFALGVAVAVGEALLVEFALASRGALARFVVLISTQALVLAALWEIRRLGAPCFRGCPSRSPAIGELRSGWRSRSGSASWGSVSG